MLTPEEAVIATFAARERGAWREVAELLHPDALESFREMRLGMLVAMERYAEEPAADTGSLTALPAGTDWIEAAGATRLKSLPGAPTVREVAQLSADEFFVRWQDASHRVPLSLKLLAIVQGRRKDARRDSSPPVVIGSVVEQEDLVHVLYRPEGREEDSPNVELFTVTRLEGQWRVGLPEHFSGPNMFTDGDVFLGWRRLFFREAWRGVRDWVAARLKRSR